MLNRDCCAAFRIPNPEPQEHLLWDSWKTTEAIVAAATSGHLINTCASRKEYNSDISIKLDLFSRECVSEHHPLHSAFCKFLSAAFSVVDQTDLQRLKQAYVFCGIVPANPTKSSTSGSTAAPGSHTPKTCWREWRAFSKDYF